MADAFRIYMDDSGNVDAKTTNAPEVRYGSITAVILPSDYLDSKFNPDFEAMCATHFGLDESGRPNPVHRRLLSSPPKSGPYAVLRDDERRAAWDAAALHMFGRAKYTVISASVDKVGWYFKYPEWRGCFYEVLVQCVLERCYYFLRHRGRAEVNIEWKDIPRNDSIKAAYRRALANGYPPNLSAAQLQSVFTSVELNILKKSQRRPGAQLADLLAAPAMQHTIHSNTGRHGIRGSFAQRVAGILEADKFYREGLKGPHGYGRVWRP